MSIVDLTRVGTPTFHTRVEAWETDFNGHWNTRFYCRSIQRAAEVAAALGGDTDPDGGITQRRHMRFHRELRTGDAVEVRSFDVAGQGEPATAHLLIHDGRVSATALDFGGRRNPALSAIPGELLAITLPRGVTGAGAPWADDAGRDSVVELGRPRADESEGTGWLAFDANLVRLATSSHHLLANLGFTADFSRRSGVGRMMVEMRFERLARLEPPGFLRGRSHLASTAAKSFITRHRICTHAGVDLARIEICTLAVDLETRKATELPAFMKAHGR